MDPDTRKRLHRYQSGERRASERQSDVHLVRSVVDSFVESEVRIPNSFRRRSLHSPCLMLHREEIGGDDADRVIDFVIERFARGLVGGE